MPVASRELEVRCKDGRRLFVRVTGSPTGTPVLFHSGIPNSRQLFEPMLESGAARGLCHICYSRPGYEGSDRKPGRRVVDCVPDSLVIADALGVERFHVVGHSGGGPHALVCAACAPDRVMSAAVLAGCAPRSALGRMWTARMGRANLEEFRAVEEGDAALERFLKGCVAELGSVKSSDDFTAVLEGLDCEADRRCLNGAFLEYQLEGCRDIANGEIWGWFDDDKAIWGDWGIDIAEVSVPVTIWHGSEDRAVPLAHAEWLAENIPTAQARILPGEGHHSLIPSHYGAVLDDLILSATASR